VRGGAHGELTARQVLTVIERGGRAVDADGPAPGQAIDGTPRRPRRQRFNSVASTTTMGSSIAIGSASNVNASNISGAGERREGLAR
jgi:hypothetical protein